MSYLAKVKTKLSFVSHQFQLTESLSETFIQIIAKTEAYQFTTSLSGPPVFVPSMYLIFRWCPQAVNSQSATQKPYNLVNQQKVQISAESSTSLTILKLEPR